MTTSSADERSAGERERRVLVHIGMPKTGTSSLQQAIGDYPNLAAHPWAAGTSGALRRSIMDELCYGAHMAPALLDALVTQSQADRALPVIMSDERMVGSTVSHDVLGHVGIEEVARRISTMSWDPVILITFREPRRLLRSSYGFEVRHGSPRSYGSFLSDISEQVQRRRGPYAVQAIADIYVERFGADRIAIGLFEDLIASPGRFWDGVAGLLNLSALARFGKVPVPHLNSAMLGPPLVDLTINRHLARSRYLPKGALTPVPRGAFGKIVKITKVSRFAGRHYTPWFTEEAQLARIIGSEMASVGSQLGTEIPAIYRGSAN